MIGVCSSSLKDSGWGYARNRLALNERYGLLTSARNRRHVIGVADPPFLRSLLFKTVREGWLWVYPEL
jgi:hypothetical protein